MKKHHTLRRFNACLMACFFCAIAYCADTHITLLSGQQISGNILFQDSDVIVIKTDDGTRYQYLKSEIKNITDIADNNNTQNKIKQNNTPKKVTASVQIAAGAATLTGRNWGTSINASIRIGTHNLLNKHIFLGGAIGYQAYILTQQNFQFIPITINADIPFLQDKHAPYIALAAGYGCALSKNYKGGAHAQIEIGYRYNFNTKNTLLIGIYAQLQQTTLNIDEYIDLQPYNTTTTRTFRNFGIKVGCNL
ncbi:MAG: hypothetical protein NC038_04720 [Paludibacter sp.]|nr:hypothetical protein [Bacteroidales bacterium]MCM1069340.1 hypothetical protein [Prevotella sp.]MCM1353860.1 hypothetical protein [Bacteroides sp.]MCM1442890.1 hypothetical protein [Muribaculum sp.]MCM1481935.1 hypothetical protein [Paludibacter sp.]